MYRKRRIFGGNSGYFGYSKSLNAISAEERGLCNKSQMDKYFLDEVNSLISEELKSPFKTTLKEIKDNLQYLEPDEWHHTSMYGNKTNYYSAATVARYFIAKFYIS